MARPSPVQLRLQFLFAAAALLAPLCASSADAVRDTPYFGALAVDVDLRDAARKIFHVHETIPVKSGSLTLRYPKWIPGEHSPSGTLDNLTGLKITARGKTVEWRRDLVDMFSLNLKVPEDVTQVDLTFDYLSPGEGGKFGQSASATPGLAELEWNQVAFYPAGYAVRQIPVQTSIRIPAGWHFASPLEKSADQDGTIRFAQVSFEQLVDSPLFAGQFYKQIDLAPGAAVPVRLNVFGDRAANLEITPDQIAHHQALVKQAVGLFGAQHYHHYDFLFAVSDRTGSFGLEHHQSSDDRIYADFFTDPELFSFGAGLLPHEYVHSWNGKFRRPAGLATPDYNVPMEGDLLWVYEGLTQYLGNVLTARSGLWNAQQYRDALALTAAQMDHVPGRTWRSLQDTADAAQRLYFEPRAWVSSRRAVDYYPEGELVWLDVDTKIRELSGNKHSLDDFTHAFYGIDNGSMKVTPYRFDDVVATLNAVQAYDWRAFLMQRLNSHEVGAPLDGLARGGWHLTYSETPSAMFKASEKAGKVTDRSYSLGIRVSAGEDKGNVFNVIWGSAAFDAGLIPGMTIIAVNGEEYSSEELDTAIAAAAKTRKPIALLVKNTGSFSTLQVTWFDGQKYPQLTRVDGQPDRLADITAARN